MDIDMNGEMMLGTMVSSPDNNAWLIGFAMHMMLSAVIPAMRAFPTFMVFSRTKYASGTSGVRRLPCRVHGVCRRPL